MYNCDLFLPTNTIRTPFRTHPQNSTPPENVYRFKLRVFNEMRFFFKLEICNVIKCFTCNFNMILLIPTTQQDSLLSMTTTSCVTVSYVPNKSQLEHIWNVQAVSKIHYSSSLDFRSEIIKTSPSLK